MKIKFLLSAALILSLSAMTFAQAVKITPKKITYKRTVENVPDYKKTLTIIYPKVSGLSATLNKKIEHAISYERVFDFKLEEELTEIHWLENADFTTDYNRNGILGIALTMDGSAAYPSTYTKHVVVDVKTGTQVKATEIFAANRILGLAMMLDKRLQETMQSAIAEADKLNAEDSIELTEILGERHFTAEETNHFSVGDKGVTFYYDYGFPHVALALEPNGEFLISYAELKPFIKPDGLLAKFIR